MFSTFFLILALYFNIFVRLPS